MGVGKWVKGETLRGGKLIMQKTDTLILRNSEKSYFLSDTLRNQAEDGRNLTRATNRFV